MEGHRRVDEIGYGVDGVGGWGGLDGNGGSGHTHTHTLAHTPAALWGVGRQWSYWLARVT